MEEVHSAAEEPNGYSDSPINISQPPDIKKWFSSYVYESLALTSSSFKHGETELNAFSLREEDKPMNNNVKQMSDTNLHESSLLSEPPDIANWFSSYAYESQPILDTNDPLYFSVVGEDSECVKETQAEEEETKEIEGKDVCCPSLFDQQKLVSSAKVTDFSQSQHLLSEPPPDVGKWFSSYEYQSPHLSDLEFCSPEKDQLIVEESDTEEENSSGIFRKTMSKQETIIAPGRLRSSNDCNDADTTVKEVSADGAYLNQEVGKESRSFKQEPLLVSERKDEPSFFSHSCYNPKPQSIYLQEEELRPKQNNHETISTSSSMQNTPRKSAQKEENQESDGKENVDGTGFVTMKKVRFRDQSSMKKPNRSTELKKITIEGDEEEEQRKMKKRRVLGEMWNHQLSGGGEEIAEKWSCPQKKKGKSGPPLKQLRLDAWMRKV